MHGSYRYDPRIIGNLATEARQRVKDGLLKTPYNGAMFWAFRMASSGQDRNINLLNAFRDAAAKTGGVVYQSLRDLKSYPKLQDGLGIPEIADIYSRGFAQGVSGETITVAADDSNPHDYFIRSELPILLDNPDLKSVRRLIPHPDYAEGITGLFQEKVYGSVADWLYEQRQQWFQASIDKTKKTQGRVDITQTCLGLEMKAIEERRGASSYLFHDQDVQLRVLDEQLRQIGIGWINQLRPQIKFGGS
jgi:hypothetical protein